MSESKSTSTKSWSLRNRLIVLLLLATAGLWALASYSVFQETESESKRLFDGSLRATAYLMLALVKHEMNEHGVDYTANIIDAEDVPESRYLLFQVWDRQGKLVYRSQNAPTHKLVDATQLSYSWNTAGNESLRTFVTWDSDQLLQIQIAEPLSHRSRLIWQTQKKLLLFAAIFLPITIFLIGWILVRSFAPIRWISESVEKRTAQDLAAVVVDDVPREILPLIVALNRLLARIRTSFEMERRFTADAAHELRTPLAAIRAHTQVLRSARTSQEETEALEDIVTGVDRSSRLVDQLMALARIDQAQLRMLSKETLDIENLVRYQVQEHQLIAKRKHITLSSQTSSTPVQARAEDLNILLRNLIDNALRYTPDGGVVQVSCNRSEHGVYLAVRDSGVGIPVTEREHVFERFYRVSGSESFGSGLGLSIVKRLVEQYGARISIEDGLHGRGAGFVIWFDAADKN